ncbi:hypothetical protein FKM82_014968 [Ascaphus truei]
MSVSRYRGLEPLSCCQHTVLLCASRHHLSLRDGNRSKDANLTKIHKIRIANLHVKEKPPPEKSSLQTAGENLSNQEKGDHKI